MNQQKAVMSIKIQVSENLSKDLLITDDTDINDAATQFCKNNHLADESIQVIVKHVHDIMGQPQTITNTQHHQHLYNLASRSVILLQLKRLQQKQEQELILNRECTFSPRIKTYPGVPRTEQPIELKLISSGVQKQVKIAYQQEINSHIQHNFTPQINQNSRIILQKARQKKMSMDLENNSESLKTSQATTYSEVKPQSRQQGTMDNECTFKPKILNRTLSKDRSTNVFNHLYNQRNKQCDANPKVIQHQQSFMDEQSQQLSEIKLNKQLTLLFNDIDKNSDTLIDSNDCLVYPTKQVKMLTNLFQNPYEQLDFITFQSRSIKYLSTVTQYDKVLFLLIPPKTTITKQVEVSKNIKPTKQQQLVKEMQKLQEHMKYRQIVPSIQFNVS